jgi:nucleotidyltransferase substrate binding protein (TIGR01987 family)
MDIETTYLERCTATLEKAFTLLENANSEEIEFDMYRSACIKEFEIIIEQTGKLLKKVLKPYFPTSKAVDMLVFKDVFRHASLHGIIDVQMCERWLTYRDNRNSTTHDYGVGFAEDTIKLLPQFIDDAKSIIVAINNQNN